MYYIHLPLGFFKHFAGSRIQYIHKMYCFFSQGPDEMEAWCDQHQQTNKKYPSLPNTSSQGVWKPRDVLKEHPSAMENGVLLNMFGKTPSRSSKESCFGSFGSEDLQKTAR